MLDRESLGVFSEVARKLDSGFATLPAFQNQAPEMARLEEVLEATAERLQDNYPYFHPLYAGQMLKPPHPVARLAYALAMWINPNNHALDGGRATSALEREAVAEIAGMYGWEKFLGHLCGGGTMANLEALWVAGQMRPGKKILASEQAHYTHGRISGVLQLPFETVPCDARGRMDANSLATRVERGDVGTVVATIGTTATGSLALFEKLRADARFVTAFAPELDIVVFAPKAASVSEASVLSRKIFETAARRDLHLAVAELPIRFWEENLGATKRERETITCLRSVLMKPEHFDWVDRIWDLLSSSADEILGARN